MLRIPCQATDKGYVIDKRKRAARASGILWAVKDKRKHGSVRVKVEHVFRVIRCQFGYRKAHYRGLAKNTAHVFSLMALANLYRARQYLRSKSV